MIRALLAALSVAAAALGQRITAPAEVTFGAAFEVQVEVEGAFDATALRPLVVEVLERGRWAGGERVRLRARCYELGEVALPGTPPHALRVTTSLPTPAGELEWPSSGYEAARPATSPLLSAALVAFAALALGAGFFGWRRSRRGAAAARVEPGGAWSAAAALRAVDVSQADVEAVLLQVKAILRRHLAERFGLPARVRTSEELLLLVPQEEPALRLCLQDIDLALFSQLPAAAGGPRSARDRALRFVEAAGERA